MQQCASLAVNKAVTIMESGSAITTGQSDCVCAAAEGLSQACKTEIGDPTTNYLKDCYGAVGVNTGLNLAVNCKKETGREAKLQEMAGLNEILLFQFAVFYQNKLRVGPEDVMHRLGKVHSNHTIYFQPEKQLYLHD